MRATDGLSIVEITAKADRDAAYAVRYQVFCVEQQVDKSIEFDGLDDECRHYLARLEGVPVGAARVRSLDGGDVKIERVAVLKDRRGLGIGWTLMRRVIADLEAAPDGKAAPRIVLNAQCHAESFYAALGFVTRGDVFDEAGIPHVHMVRDGGSR